MREFILKRNTAESEVLVDFGLDQYETPEIITPIKFFNHMLDLFAFHGCFKIIVEAHSNDNDPHHIIEDIAINMGMCFKTALGDKKGINRYGWASVPMDEALVLSSVDISGRPHCSFDINFKYQSINDLPVEMIQHFFESFATNACCTIHIKQLNGTNDHHIAEAIFKSFAQSLSMACSLTNKYQNLIPSSKGAL
ncbi:MAG: imidazoleglycerol-phosphate dehydratase [Cyanobacteriota bacterium]